MVTGLSGHVPEDEDELVAALAGRDPASVAARLAPYVSDERRARVEAVLAARVASVQVAIEDPGDPRNVAAIVRTAEALGAGTVHAIAAPAWPVFSPRVSMGAVYWADVRVHSSWSDFAAVLGQGARLAAACVATGEAMTPLASVPVDRPLCLVFGNEKAGLSAAARGACDLRFTIPMYGMSESLNVSVSAAIALHDVLTRRRAALGGRGDLDPARLCVLRARWYAKALDLRLVRSLVHTLEDRGGPAPSQEVAP